MFMLIGNVFIIHSCDRYTWMQIPKHEVARLKSAAQPFRTATLVGCALAVSRKYFNKIGGFDDNMNVWGGENIELAFRTWMCGGQVSLSFYLAVTAI